MSRVMNMMNGKDEIKINQSVNQLFPGNNLGQEGVKNHEKTTLLERLLLKIHRQIVITSTHIVIIALQKSKLKKEEMALRPLF